MNFLALSAVGRAKRAVIDFLLFCYFDDFWTVTVVGQYNLIEFPRGPLLFKSFHIVLNQAVPCLDVDQMLNADVHNTPSIYCAYEDIIELLIVAEQFECRVADL